MDRNFRSTYYEKVGCRSVEEKKSLNILLKDKPLNQIKLKQFCLSFTVPIAQRGLLWNLILGVLPVYPDSRVYVMNQRKIVYEDILSAVKIMRFIDEKTPKARIFYAMWLLENKKLYPEFNIYQESSFVDITETLLQVFDDDVEIYWIAKEFFEFTKEIKSEFPKLRELTVTLLEKEDIHLYNHLEKYEILNNLPLEKWYTSCFAGVIREPSCLVRVWDKICGGSRKIVVFVLIVILKTMKMSIMRSTTVQQVKEIVEKKKEDQDDLIVNKAIESWQNNKNHSEFMVH